MKKLVYLALTALLAGCSSQPVQKAEQSANLEGKADCESLVIESMDIEREIRELGSEKREETARNYGIDIKNVIMVPVVRADSKAAYLEIYGDDRLLIM